MTELQQEMQFALARGLDKGQIRAWKTDWAELAEALKTPEIGAKDGPYWCPADFGESTQRKKANVRTLSMLVLDVEAKDEQPPPLADILHACKKHGWCAMAHTTYTHRPDKPRYRLLMAPNRPIEPDELRVLVEAAALRLGIFKACDLAASGDPARLYYLPRIPDADALQEFQFEEVDGEAIDVDELLADALERMPAPPMPTAPHSVLAQDAYAKKALANAITGVCFAVEGERNTVLNASAYGLARLSAAGRVDWNQASRALQVAAQSVHLPPNEVKATLASANKAGMQNPNLKGIGREGSMFSAEKTTVGSTVDWPEPATLPDALPPVAAFDTELLPEALRDWVTDIAHRMQCPPDFPAVGAVVALSSLIGARAVVKPKERDDWAVVPNLWGLVVGRPGVMKSPALAQVLNPLQQLESTEREKWQFLHDVWELDCKVAELAMKQNEKQAAGLAAKDPGKARGLLQPIDTPTEPLARRYVVNDATVEKLGEILEANPWGTLSYRDEIHGLLCNMDRQGQEGARAFYLQAYDGNQGYVFDRITRGTHYIPRVCLSLLGGIQPGKVQSYVREAVVGGAGDDGLLQRFGLAVWPDVTREFVYVDKWPDTPAKQMAWEVFERLNGLQPASDNAPQEWRFTPEAQALFVQWLEPFETEIRGEELHPALVSHLSKYRKLVTALALIFALVDTPDSGNVIQERELLRALAWCDYLRTHAQRLYAAAVIPETTGARQLLDKIRSGKLHDADGVLLEAFTPRLVAVKHWAGLATPEAARKAADLLADYGWLVKEAAPSSPTGGRPSERYLIHPTLLKVGS